MEAAFHRIPTELLDEIAEYVGYAYSQFDFGYPGARASIESKKDLCALSLVTKRFQASAQRLLMRTISLSDERQHSDESFLLIYAQFYCLLRTLLDRPDLAQKVQKLKLDVHCDRYVQSGYRRDEYEDELSAYGCIQERDKILDRCSDFIQASSFSATQKAKWEYDMCHL
jgi:hypothetical protein